MGTYIDPLEGLEARPLETQVAVLATEVRNQRNSINGLRLDMKGLGGDVAALRKVLMSLAVSIAGSAVIFALSIFMVFK